MKEEKVGQEESLFALTVQSKPIKKGPGALDAIPGLGPHGSQILIPLFLTKLGISRKPLHIKITGAYQAAKILKHWRRPFEKIVLPPLISWPMYLPRDKCVIMLNWVQRSSSILLAAWSSTFLASASLPIDSEEGPRLIVSPRASDCLASSLAFWPEQAIRSLLKMVYSTNTLSDHF